MHFSIKNYLKSNHYNTTKHSQIARWCGGEFEYAGSAQRSEKGKFSFTKPISSEKDVSFLGTLTLMVIEELFEMI
jgi:hypothetical protein